MRYFLFAFVFLISACTTTPTEKPDDDKKVELRLTEGNFSALPGWSGDDMQSFIPAFKKSCERILKKPSDAKAGPLKEAGTYGDWQPVCRSFLNVSPNNAKAFIQNRFTPYLVSDAGDKNGLFTGYYEASLKGSTTQHGPYQTPLYKRPDDLVMVQLGDFREKLKGERIAGRVVDGNLKPYESRAQIVAGQWPHNGEVLVWVDDPIDAFFVQIQGSGVVQMDNGGALRIGYAGQNGHVYYAIGRELIKRGELTKENVSLQTIRAWLENNPSQADEIMNANASYVFFRKLDGEGPIGGEGVPLTAGRSLAVDRSLISYGVPVWADIEPPYKDAGPLQRLMVAQDTGGAIRGAVRGDVFWGYGDRAEDIAGPMKSRGQYWILLPR